MESTSPARTSSLALEHGDVSVPVNDAGIALSRRTGVIIPECDLVTADCRAGDRTLSSGILRGMLVVTTEGPGETARG